MKWITFFLIGLISCGEYEVDNKHTETNDSPDVIHTNDHLIKDVGSIENRIYTNDEIGLEITLPEDWEIQDHNDILKWTETYNDSCSYNDRIENDFSTSMLLFQCTQSTGNSLMDFPCNIACGIESFDVYKISNGVTCSSEIGYIQQFDKAYHEGEPDTPISYEQSELLNDIEFFTWTDKSVLNKEEGRNFYLKLYVKKLDNFFLFFQVSYLDYKSCSNEINPTLQSIKLDAVDNEI